MKRVRTLAVALLVFALAAPAGADVTDPGGSFFDDDGIVHEGAIEAIRIEDVTRGCNPPQNTNFCPDEPVTRGQMAAFLARALDLEPGKSSRFVDTSDSVFADDIDRLAHAGITRGCNPPENSRFCPDAPVTRGQMAAFLVRAFGYSDPGPGDRFDDDNGSVFEGDIDRLAHAGITRGCNPPENNRFCPDALVTRAEMATFLARALELPITEPPARADTQDGERLNLLELAEAQGCDIATGTEGGPTVCEASAEIPAGEPFWVQHGWFLEADGSLDANTFELTLNGTTLDMFEEVVVEDGRTSRQFSFQFPGSLTPTTHELVGTWLWDGTPDLRVILELKITP